MLTGRSVASPATPGVRPPRARLQDYADRFLNTEFAILSHDDTKVVITMTIPLAVIGRNDHMLRDLPDLSASFRPQGWQVKRGSTSDSLRSSGH